MSKTSITIIGGGVIGCALAYELSKENNYEIYLIEKNSKIKSDNQSSRNSGVIHAGIYYSKSKTPLKSRLCKEGNSLLYDFCKKYYIPHKRTGKLVIATTELEEEYLEDLLTTIRDNEIPGVKKISKDKISELEPNVKSTSGLYIPTSGIIESTSLVERLYLLAKNNGVLFAIGNGVIDINRKSNQFEITAKTNNEISTFETDIVINSAGIYSDKIARMINPDSSYEIHPIRGEFAVFSRTKRPELFINNTNIYPTPYGIWPDGTKVRISLSKFKKLCEEKKVMSTVGIHLTPILGYNKKGEYNISNEILIGPAQVGNIEKEDFKPTYPESSFIDGIKHYFPNISLRDIRLYQTGIQAKLKKGHDFVIERDKSHPNFINLIGIDSPGLTSSLAIAEYVKRLLSTLSN